MNEFQLLISKDKIQQKVLELGKRLSKDYKDKNPIFLGILKGSFVFLADLIRATNTNLFTEFVELSSYRDQMISSGVVTVSNNIRFQVEGKHILIVEDIIDTGLTLNYLIKQLQTQKPASIKICSLLVKKDKHKLSHPIDYVGFEILDKFLIGYGLDYKGFYRNLDYIAIIE